MDESSGKFMGKHTLQNQEALGWMGFHAFVKRAYGPQNDEEKNETQIDESSLSQLHRSTLDAFPKTAKRQHATDTIKITKLTWMPFEGVRTLFVKGLAQNEGKEYSPLMLFKNVVFSETGLPVIANDQKTYHINPISFEQNDVIIRCQCKDFFWRFQHWNKVDEALYGKDRKKYEAMYRPDSSNPLHLPGMCKHLLKLVKVLRESKILY